MKLLEGKNKMVEYFVIVNVFELAVNHNRLFRESFQYTVAQSFSEDFSETVNNLKEKAINDYLGEDKKGARYRHTASIHQVVPL